MTRIFEEVAHEFEHGIHRLAQTTHIINLTSGNTTTTGAGMGLTEIITDAENVVDKARDDAQAAIAHAKTLAASIESNPIIQEVLKLAADTPIPVLQQVAAMIGPVVTSLAATHTAQLTAPAA